MHAYIFPATSRKQQDGVQSTVVFTDYTENPTNY